jgi:wobble nucleotide-excising tRNase
MIKEIRLENLATYVSPVIMHPLEINFCYGSNGSGKTTLSNLIGTSDNSIESKVFWHEDKKLQVLVYNKKFVEENFGGDSQIAGIFTLGKDSKEAQDFIVDIKTEIDKITKLIEKNERNLILLSGEKAKSREKLEDICWSVQQKYGEKFKNAIIGFRGSKKSFAEKCLIEYPNFDESNPPLLKGIEDLYLAAYSETNDEYQINPQIDTTNLEFDQVRSLLEMRISGSNETPIGAFIEYLRNSDWVRKGTDFAKRANGVCPYCQQELPTNIQIQLENFFDEEYQFKLQELSNFLEYYKSFTDNLLIDLMRILNCKLPILKYELFEIEIELLRSIIQKNIENIEKKISSPSTVVSLDSFKSNIDKINEIIADQNSIIKKNNDIVRNQKQEQKNCQNLVWSFFTYELRESIRQYNKEQKGRDTGIISIETLLTQQHKLINEQIKLIEEREKTLTSVIPTVNDINGILVRFGFDGFKIAENFDVKGTYKIVRKDGSNANKTLSEGEYNFITFLYFYHLVYGSHSRTGLANSKVVVIDDPISSLDSNILFIISTLTRTMLSDCKDKKNGIKQIFLLTHNVYFHKEITYLGSREKYPTSRTAYWVIRKIDNKSEIVKHQSNPIQTSYELLWADLKDASVHNRATIFNTLRRILEYYFNVIGGLNYEKCIDKFDGEDKIVCKSLISCINDGSHFISDDFVMCFESDSIEKYLRIFKLIFERMDHESHYTMMMASSELDS